MSRSKLAGIYAKAFADALGKDKGQKEVEALSSLCDLIEGHRGLKMMIDNVTIGPESKRAVLAELMRALDTPEKVQRLVEVVAKNRRLSHLASIKDEIRRVLEDRAGIVPIQLSTARRLTAAQKKSFETAVGKALSSKVRLEASEDESLIGGAVATVQSRVFDGSIRGRLNRMRRELIKE